MTESEPSNGGDAGKVCGTCKNEGEIVSPDGYNMERCRCTGRAALGDQP